jgi:hypothetical protein
MSITTNVSMLPRARMKKVLTFKLPNAPVAPTSNSLSFTLLTKRLPRLKVWAAMDLESTIHSTLFHKCQ